MSDVAIDLIGDEELLRFLDNLEYSTQQKFLKRILRDTATQTFVKGLRRDAPPSRTLKRSMGHVTGKSRRVATIFAGPRMSLSKAQTDSGYKGWLANIIEYNKFQNRYPGKDRRGIEKKRPRLPDGSIRRHSGVFPWKPFIRQSLARSVRPAEEHQFKSIKKLILKEWNKYTKK